MIRKKLDTKENREFWATIDKIIAEVATWPAWKRHPIGDPWLDSEKDLSVKVLDNYDETS